MPPPQLFAAVRTADLAVLVYLPIFMEYLSILPYPILKRISYYLDSDRIMWIYRDNGYTFRAIEEALHFYCENQQLIERFGKKNDDERN